MSVEGFPTAKPVLLAVDDKPEALGKVEHELRERYGSYGFQCRRRWNDV